MKKFAVRRNYTAYHIVIIEADTEEEAEIVSAIIGTKDKKKILETLVCNQSTPKVYEVPPQTKVSPTTPSDDLWIDYLRHKYKKRNTK